MKALTYLKNLRNFQIIIVNSFAQWGGGTKPIIDFWKNSLIDRQNIILIQRDSRYSHLKLFAALILSRKVVLDGLFIFNYWDILLFCFVKKNVKITLHESKYSIEDYYKRNPRKIYLFKYIIKNRSIGCASKYQESYLIKEFHCLNTTVIYEGIHTIPTVKFNKNAINILMIGYYWNRKGINLFSRTADLANKENLNFEFYWVGSGIEVDEFYFSKNVTWISETDKLSYILNQIDIYFLSSIDEPLGLSALEAIAHFKKIVCFKDTGIAELILRIEGCEVFNNYNEKCALESIKKANMDELNHGKISSIIDEIEIKKYSSRLKEFLSK